MELMYEGCPQTLKYGNIKNGIRQYSILCYIKIYHSMELNLIFQSHQERKIFLFVLLLLYIYIGTCSIHLNKLTFSMSQSYKAACTKGRIDIVFYKSKCIAPTNNDNNISAMHADKTYSTVHRDS